ncbi:MAG TPA: ABC transporter ATP-binding protein [Thermofilum sp.]|nr:ABC transporter ATP-binding protein [Thermofilum sp.]
MAANLLSVINVAAYYRQQVGTSIKTIKAVDGVDLYLYEKEILGIVGESGSGKSTLANVILMNIKKPLEFVKGSVRIYTGNGFLDLNSMSVEELRTKVWGKEIALIPQSAMNALMPTLKIKRIILDVIRSHQDRINEKEVVEKAAKRFRELGLPEKAIDMYPFELSGGMRQRAVIAVATLLNPRILIADEPSSALDVVSQRMVLKTFYDLLRKNIIKSMIFISHDIATVRQIATDMCVMYAGKIVERGSTDELIRKPLHPYTEGLIGSIPSVEPGIRERKLKYIPGQPPDLSNPPTGCRFHPRCPYTMKLCKVKEPPMVNVGNKRLVACWLHVKR